MIYGAIIGDIVGSRFEFIGMKSKEFAFFDDQCFFTDDTVMTIAVAEALAMTTGKRTNLPGITIGCMQSLGQRYPNCGWGGMFGKWIFSDNPEPYNSFGNGAAMRVSACGWYGKDIPEVRRLSKMVTGVSHDHEEGLKGAECVAVAVYYARKGESKETIREVVQKRYYDIDFTLDEIRPTYKFNETCQDTVPQAIVAFLESDNFEDAIRNAVSLGGDADTLAAIAGSIAEAYYGIPQWMKEEARSYLTPDLQFIADCVDPV